ncbi:MAG: peptide ABC transporter substrate-binding protein [Simkaniaceae bacterium]|nr:peptide ABC transporter substrate-binding protein [Simkaniaceae bacterium]
MKTLSFILLILTISSCGNKKATPQNKALNLSFDCPIRTLNPTTTGETPAHYAVSMLFEGLTRLDAQGNIALAVAEKHTVSEDFKRHTFKLRETFWSDGMPVTAYDFAYAWKKCIDPKTGSLGAQFFHIVKNAKPATQGKAPLSEVEIKALDAHTLEIELEHPVPYLLDLLKTVHFYPIPKHLDEIDSSWIHRTDQTFVSNGPFKLKTWKQEEGITVEKNPFYWDQKHVFLPEIRISFIGDGMTALYMYEKNELDWMGGPFNTIPQEALKTFKQQKDYSRVDIAGVDYFSLNSQTFPFHNKKMRQAFSYALDRHAIADHILDGSMTPSYGVISPFFGLGNSACFEDNKFDEAKRLFSEALVEEGLTLETFPGVTLSYSTGPEILSRIAQTAQQVWEQTFGIKVTLSSLDWPVYITAVRRGDYQIGKLGYKSNIDPIRVLQFFKYKHEPMNTTNWESQEYIDLLEASNHETDFEKRKALLTAAEKVLMDEMPIIPIHYKVMEFSKNPRLVGVVVSKGDVDFRFARFSH